MNKRRRILLSLAMIAVMVLSSASFAFADTTSWLSFQGNNQNNGLISGTFPVEPTWGKVKLVSEDASTGWSGIDCQPLMQTEKVVKP